MGLTERHWFENEDVPENYEWALEDAVYNSYTNKKADTVEVVRCKNDKEAIVHDLNVAKLMLCNRQMLTPEMRVRIGQAITSALVLLKEHEVVEPINSYGTFRCGNCRNIVGYNDGHGRGYQNNFCSNCGLAVKWNG